MTRGFVTSFNTRRGTGFVRQATGTERIPFSTRATQGRSFRTGEAVEFSVTGGKAGVVATTVRPLSRSSD
jgi:cold shock CspA family protein